MAAPLVLVPPPPLDVVPGVSSLEQAPAATRRRRTPPAAAHHGSSQQITRLSCHQQAGERSPEPHPGAPRSAGDAPRKLRLSVTGQVLHLERADAIVGREGASSTRSIDSLSGPYAMYSACVGQD
jgi:hypothetical protein